MSTDPPAFLADLAHPDESEDTSAMLHELAHALLGELARAAPCDGLEDAFRLLTVATHDTAALARAATFAKPGALGGLTARSLRTLGMSAASAHPPAFAHSDLDDPAPRASAEHVESRPVG